MSAGSKNKQTKKSQGDDDDSDDSPTEEDTRSPKCELDKIAEILNFRQTFHP